MATEAPEIRIEPNPRRIRGVVDGVTVVDSTRTRFVWEHRYYPAWYVPSTDVVGELVPNGGTVESDQRGVGARYDLVVGGRTIADAAWRHVESPVEQLRDLVRFEWDAMDAWFEENTEVFVHPRSPETRVDALPSSRHVRVLIDGEVVADSVRPTILYETGLPPRYYLPKLDVRMDLLTPTGTTTACPYKGWANYWSVTIGDTTHDDVVWGYRTPLPESEAVAGLVCFYDERVDVEIDGEPVERPRTKFS
jgi:uncharacterized protein (DUF427 family)